MYSNNTHQNFIRMETSSRNKTVFTNRDVSITTPKQTQQPTETNSWAPQSKCFLCTQVFRAASLVWSIE